MGKLFCIMGKSATGKDTIYKRLIEDPALGLRKVVPYTTRPVRAGERDGEDYHFVDTARFLQMREQGQVIESRTYHTHQGDWTYFTADDGQIDLQTGSFLLVGTLEVYGRIREYFGPEQVIPLYIEVADGIRIRRALDREDEQACPDYEEMCRRYLADAQDFSEEKLRQAGILKKYENRELEKCLRQLSLDILPAIKE